MSYQTSIIFDLTAQGVGNTAEKNIEAGLYKYMLDSTLGTSSVVKPQILSGVDWMDITSIAETAITKTASGATTQIFDVYIPSGKVRINVATDTITSGFATFAPILTNNV